MFPCAKELQTLATNLGLRIAAATVRDLSLDSIFLGDARLFWRWIGFALELWLAKSPDLVKPSFGVAVAESCFEKRVILRN